MATRMLIDATHPEETRVVVQKGNRVEEFDFETSTKLVLKGNIYLAKVTRVEPSLQAAFVEYGGNRHGFLAFSEIHPDYYQIPVADRQALLAMQAEEEARAAAEEEAEEEAAAEAYERGESGDFGGNLESVETIAATDDSANLIETIDNAPGSAQPASTDFDRPAYWSLPEQSGTDQPVLARDPEQHAHSHEHDGHHETHEHHVEHHEGETHQEAAHEQAHDDHAADHEGETHDGDVVATSADGEQPEAVSADAGNGERGNSGRQGNERQRGPRRRRERDEERKPRRSAFLRRYKIQEVIKRRQILLIQVVKEERGNKGAALTTYLSLAGRYCVLMPNTARGGGISRKIQSPADRRRLKSITSEIDVPEGMGMIVRTAGMERSKQEIKRDFEYLLRTWDNIRELTLRSSAPCLIYEEAELIKRSIRDVYSSGIDEVLVEGESGFQAARDFMRMLTPDDEAKVRLYQDRIPLFHRFQVESQLENMFSPTVQLRSGGYIVLNPTEALVAIDVNSGKSTREHNIEETAYKTNLEAAEEIARQLRLRDLAGLVVIDFIDMEDNRNIRNVERRLKEHLKSDRARIQVGRISPFGLLEMSRQRLRPSLIESSTRICPHCEGRGYLRSTESAAVLVLRMIEEEGIRDNAAEIAVHVATDVAIYILNNKRDALVAIEARYGMRVNVLADQTLTPPAYRIERVRSRQPGESRVDRGEDHRRAITQETAYSEPVARNEEFARIDEEDDAEEEVEFEASESGERDGRGGADSDAAGQRRRRRRRRRGRGRDREGFEGGQRSAEGGNAETADGEATASDGLGGDLTEVGEAIGGEQVNAEGGRNEGGRFDGNRDGGRDGGREGRRRRGRRGGRNRRGFPDGNQGGQQGVAGTGEQPDIGHHDSANEYAPPPIMTPAQIGASFDFGGYDPYEDSRRREPAPVKAPEMAQPIEAPKAPETPKSETTPAVADAEKPSAPAILPEQVAPEVAAKPVFVSSSEPEAAQEQKPKRGWWRRT